MKKKLAIYIILFLCLITSVSAQDSLIYFNEIVYHSEFEERAFADFFKEKETNYLALFLATSPEVNAGKFEEYQKRYTFHVKEINTDKLSKKKVEKRIKSIYEEIHRRFLQKYEAQNSMNAIFLNGSYNCVSASALYSMVFEDLDIPYSIKEKPTHVYVVAYPKSERILVESTDPSGGFIAFDDRYKRAYIQQMTKAKIIGPAEANSKSVNQLFDEYFFTDKDINLQQLLGVQYVNEALYFLEEDKKEKALEQLEKAYLFFPDEKFKTLLLALNADILSSSNYERIELADNLINISRFQELEITQNDILGEFGRISQVYLVDSYKPEVFEQFYERIIAGVKDNNLKKEISYIYFYEQGRVLYNLGKYGESLPFFEEAYKLKPDNTDIARLFVNTIGLKLSNESNNDVTVETLELYQERIPKLMKNNVFKSFLVNSYLIQFGQAFELRNEKKGLKYKTLFEKNFNKELTINKTNVGRAYSLAAVYYFRKGYSSKARSILDTGLEIAPSNHELLSRRRLIN